MSNLQGPGGWGSEGLCIVSAILVQERGESGDRVSHQTVSVTLFRH